MICVQNMTLTIGRRGQPFSPSQIYKDHRVVILNTDISKVFPTSESVNTVLHLVTAMPKPRKAKMRKTSVTIDSGGERPCLSVAGLLGERFDLPRKVLFSIFENGPMPTDDPASSHQGNCRKQIVRQTKRETGNGQFNSSHGIPSSTCSCLLSTVSVSSATLTSKALAVGSSFMEVLMPCYSGCPARSAGPG